MECWPCRAFPFTCSPLHTAVLEEETPTGRMQVLRMCEFERIRRVVYQMDFYPPHGRFLHARISLYNLRDEVVPYVLGGATSPFLRKMRLV